MLAWVEVTRHELLGVGFDAFNERAAGEVVWLEAVDSHLVEEVPCFVHLIATHEDINEGVVGHIVRLETDELHLSEELLRLISHSLLCTPFDQGIE